MARFLLVALVVLAGTILSPSGGSAQQTGVAAEIRQGNCDQVGEVVAPLVEARLPAGEPRGNAAAMPAANSFTTVPLSLAALTASDHAIVIPFPVEDRLVACGAIGGTLTEAGSLIVGLAPQGDTEISGIVYLSPSPDPTQTNVSLFVTGEGLDLFLSATFLPPTVAEEDAARFTEALAARDGSPSLAGPFAGQLVQRQGLPAVRAAGIAAADFSASATFVNPTEHTETPWHVGFAFHVAPGRSAPREFGVGSDGTWYFIDPTTGMLGAGPLTTFDATPGATNTLDLVVEGTTALLGVNGELATRLDLPTRFDPPIGTASDVLVTTDYFAENVVEGREVAFTGFEVWGLPGTTVPSTAEADDDAARFTAALTARDAASRLAGPFGGRLPQSTTMLAARPAGIAAEAFSATATFVNPTDQPAAPWDYGLAFHLDQQASTVQEVYLDAVGFWYYTDFPNGVQQSGTVPTFDPSPGGTNTIDLIVDGATALLGVNGAFVARIELPSAMAADVLAATDFVGGNVVEGRGIVYSGFEVWSTPGLASLPTTPAAAGPDDSARFADVLEGRSATTRDAGPFADVLVQRLGSLTLWGSDTTPAPFSATVTFVNPTEQTETPWEVGFAFAWIQGRDAQNVYLDSDGFWYSAGTPSGFVPAFDTAPGAANTLDLVVEGDAALFGVNGEFVARLDLPTPPGSGFMVGTGFSSNHVVDGREIVFRDFTVWT
jgi:hypothetical protein